MSAGPHPWPQVFTASDRVLLIVNSAASQVDEIERVIAALQNSAGLERVAAIAPSAIKRRLIHRGLDAGSILVPRVAGLEVEFGDFLERPAAVRWAIERSATVITASEPYPPRNEDVKADLERRVAPMLGGARFAVHSLPADDVFVLTAEDLWNRAAIAEAKGMHQARVDRAFDQLRSHWQRDDAAGAAAAAAATLDGGQRPDDQTAARVASRRYSLDRLSEAVRGISAPSGRVPRILVQPENAVPTAGWLPGSIAPVRRPAQLGSGVRLHGTRLVFRGVAAGPYAYLVMSRPVQLKPGDAVMADGRVYRGGITIGLVKGDAWASRVDVDEPGSFLAAAVASEPGPHALVIAHCLKGDERNAAIVLRRFGWAKT